MVLKLLCALGSVLLASLNATTKKSYMTFCEGNLTLIVVLVVFPQLMLMLLPDSAQNTS